MRRQTVFLLVTGLAAMFASLMVYSALRQKDNEVQQARIQTVQILVAARDLKLGDKLDASALKAVAWPRGQTPPGSMTESRAVTGSIVKSPFETNEPIVTSKLFNGDRNSGLLPLLIPPEMRAMSVAVDEVADISGFVLPHSRVDVLAALNTHNAERAKIILENVEVLAVAQDIEGKDKPQLEKVVTFLVTPEEAERLTLASHEGVLRLALRSYGDSHIVSTAGSDVEAVMAAYGTQPAPTPVPAPRPILRERSHRLQPVNDEIVEIIRDGKNYQQVHFAQEDNAPASHDEADAADPAAEARNDSSVPDAPTVKPDTLAQAPAGKTIDVP
jgi:pilus assembly protein CpaB